MKKTFGIIGGLIVALAIASAAQAAVVTVSCSPGNSPANPILNASAQNLASGSYVQVVDSTDSSTSVPNATTGLPSSGTDTVVSSGTLSAAGTFTKSGVSIPTGHYVYIVAWDTWTGSGTPSGNYGISTISGAMAGVSYTYKPASFQTGTPIAPVSLSSATPSSAYQGDIVTSVALVGVNSHFSQGTSTTSFGSGISVGSTTVSDTTHATANTVTINCNATAGTRAVTVTTNAETASGNVFTVSAPSISNISPSSANQGTTSNSVTITGVGSHFINGTTSVAFSGSGITVNSTTVSSVTSLVVNFDIASGATTGSRTVTVTTNLGARGTETLTTSFTVNSAGTATLSSISPNTGAQGQTLDVTLTGSNTNWSGSMTSSVIFSGSGITVNSATASTATSIAANITIASGATTGSRSVSVTGTSGTVSFTVTSSSTTPATSITIDDYEGAAGNSSNNCSSYYEFGPDASSEPTATRVTNDKHGGTYSMDTVYSSIANSQNAWRGWGGVLVKTLDLDSYDTLSVWVKGDGSSNKLKFQVKDADGTNFGMSDSDAISLASTSWTEYRITDFKSKMSRVTGTTSGDADLDWTQVIEYQFVFTGTAASTGIYIDDVIVSVGSSSETPHITGITPSTGAEKVTVTITGTNFKTGGTVNFAGGGVITSVKSSDTNSLITSWSSTEVVLSLPRMSAGTKTVNLVRSDSVASDNSVTFEVTASATVGAGVTYNYPNPFNPLSGQTTTIVFDPGNSTAGRIHIFDMAARQIAKIEWTATGGSLSVAWNGKNNYDEIVGDGVYLYRIVDSGGKLINKGKILVINK